MRPDSISDLGKKQVVVTGATGFVGRQLCSRLLDLGVVPLALVRRSDEALEQLGIEVKVVSLCDEPKLKTILVDADIVIHCAANATFGNGPQYEKDNVDSTQTLLRATPPSCRFVFLSTIGAVDRPNNDDCREPLTESSQPNPSSDYGRSKLTCEQLVRDSGLPFVIIRPSMVVGPTMRFDSHFSAFANMALRGSLFSRINWPGIMSVIHVDDLVEAIIHCSACENTVNQTYFCAGERVPIGVFLKQVTPQRAMLNIGWLAQAFSPLVSRMPFQLKALLLPALTASDDLLRRTGWSPKTSSDDLLAGVILREKQRVDPELDHGGLTVITGAASGLGRAFVEELAPKRSAVVIIDRDAKGLDRLTKAFPHCRAVILDLSKDKQVQAEIRKLIKSENIYELYACAGVGARGPVQQIEYERQKQMMAVNVLARLAMALPIAAQMARCHVGRIVFVSSSSAFQPLPNMAVYAASNSALLSLGEAWGAELRRSGVRMLTICPGGMSTNFQKSSGVKELEGEKLMPPEDVVRQTMSALKGNRLSIAISFRSFAMSMLARILPRDTSVSLWMRLMEKMR